MTSEPTGFLYPFIEAEERDAPALLDDLSQSARNKMADSRQLRLTSVDRCGEQLEAAGSEMAIRFERGARLLAFGNGGSATDADGAVDLFSRPTSGRPLPALSLASNTAVLTALANDVGFELVFSRQIIAYGRQRDIALGFSTSGDSPNLLRAFNEAASRGLLTVGLCGYEGSAMAGSDAVNHCVVVQSESVHRIQEAQDALLLRLWMIVQRHLRAEERP